jgi:5'-nucleotidase
VARTATAIASAASVLALAATAARAEPQVCASGPLDILVTNDDGYLAPGIRALQAALKSAGHRTRLIAPAADSSGGSVSFSWRPLQVTVEATDPMIIGVVGGTPANSVVLGVTALYPAGSRPDVVISGINDGANTGRIVPLSGTVGAAVAAVALLDPPVPAIAISADRLPNLTEEQKVARATEIARHFAAHLPQLRAALCAMTGSDDGSGVLSVNYPGRPVADIRGIRGTTVDLETDLEFRYQQEPDGSYVMRYARKSTAAEGTSELHLLQQGFVTVAPLDARYEDDLSAEGALSTPAGSP